MTGPAFATTVRPALPTDLRLTLLALRRGPYDPHLRFEADAVWRACRTPHGPGTLRLAQRPDGEIAVAAWGPGAEWLVASAPDLTGARDSLDGWDPPYAVLRDAATRNPGFRVPRSGLVLDAVVPAIIEQRVTGQEAWRSWRQLVRRWGEPAPGPSPGLYVPPSAELLARLPSWEWHRLGVEEARARVVRFAAQVAHRLEEAVTMAPEDALRRLRVVPGIGPWTAAETAQRALGDADAVSVGDLHLPAFVGWVLAGHRVDDDGMLELLEPVRGHRYRATRLLELSGLRHPRFGPRYNPRDIRRE
ncbi:MAG TPA: DNA-3-methyladenine glycosylase 2 family protein [Mycobacteriales bacterium]|nr:DNA-3-methyladenine glycosylase 2 family protein [Mycobacteriales bacterium]